MSDYDYRKANSFNRDMSDMAPTVHVDPAVIIEEHPGVSPVSYMAYSNTVSMLHDIMEIMEMMNNCDELPQWVDQSLSEAADRVGKAKRYIMGEKSKGTMPSAHDHAAPALSACSCGCEACGAGTCHCPADCACGCRASDYDFTMVVAASEEEDLESLAKKTGGKESWS